MLNLMLMLIFFFLGNPVGDSESNFPVDVSVSLLGGGMRVGPLLNQWKAESDTAGEEILADGA